MSDVRCVNDQLKAGKFDVTYLSCYLAIWHTDQNPYTIRLNPAHPESFKPQKFAEADSTVPHVVSQCSKDATFADRFKESFDPLDPLVETTYFAVVDSLQNAVTMHKLRIRQILLSGMSTASGKCMLMNPRNMSSGSDPLYKPPEHRLASLLILRLWQLLLRTASCTVSQECKQPCQNRPMMPRMIPILYEATILTSATMTSHRSTNTSRHSLLHDVM